MQSQIVLSDFFFSGISSLIPYIHVLFNSLPSFIQSYPVISDKSVSLFLTSFVPFINSKIVPFWSGSTKVVLKIQLNKEKTNHSLWTIRGSLNNTVYCPRQWADVPSECSQTVHFPLYSKLGWLWCAVANAAVGWLQSQLYYSDAAWLWVAI